MKVGDVDDRKRFGLRIFYVEGCGCNTPISDNAECPPRRLPTFAMQLQTLTTSRRRFFSSVPALFLLSLTNTLEILVLLQILSLHYLSFLIVGGVSLCAIKAVGVGSDSPFDRFKVGVRADEDKGLGPG